MFTARTPLMMITLATTFFLSSNYLVACGRQAKEEKKDTPSESTGGGNTSGGEANPQTVTIDGRQAPFVRVGDKISYDGKLKEDQGVNQFQEARAFVLTATTTLHVSDSVGTSSDCKSPEDYIGPTYMVLKMPVDPKADPEIVRSTEGIETSGGTSIPATELAQFPGSLDAGTYVIVVDYLSIGKICSVTGSFVLGQ